MKRTPEQKIINYIRKSPQSSEKFKRFCEDRETRAWTRAGVTAVAAYLTLSYVPGASEGLDYAEEKVDAATCIGATVAINGVDLDVAKFMCTDHNDAGVDGFGSYEDMVGPAVIPQNLPFPEAR